jgi:small nuclear ribonucleoprotein (snRNP)-like protein
MKNITIILTIIIGLSKSILCQDIDFTWQISPSFGKAIIVNVANSNIIIKGNTKDEAIVTKMCKSDYDSLSLFLKKYDFPLKGSTIEGSIIREYYETKLLSDPNWVIFQGDSVRKKSLELKGYLFDIDSNKYYSEIQGFTSWTDGNTYKGELIAFDQKKTFNIYSSRMSEMDYELNKLILYFIIKYDTKNDYARLKAMIEGDKPRN